MRCLNRNHRTHVVYQHIHRAQVRLYGSCCSYDAFVASYINGVRFRHTTVCDDVESCAGIRGHEDFISDPGP